MRSAWLALLLLPLAIGCGRRGSSETMIQNKGSDSLVNVATAWAEAYKKVKPDVLIAVSDGGSGVGISALINGTVDIANASREMEPEEIAAAEKNGIEPKKFIVGYDALAVYVHPDNPIPSLTLAQLAEIYGEGGKTTKWSQLGVKVPGCDSDEIVRVSRQNSSGTYAYFRETALGENRDYKLGSRDMQGSKDVVDLVAHTPCAIGYSGLAYATPDVKLVPIAKDDASPPVAPSKKTAIDRTYPIARPLFMYVNGEPKGAVKDYIDWVLSDAGQKILAEKGYAPIRPLGD